MCRPFHHALGERTFRGYSVPGLVECQDTFCSILVLIVYCKARKTIALEWHRYIILALYFILVHVMIVAVACTFIAGNLRLG